MRKITLAILIILFGFLGTAQWQQFNDPQGGSVSDILSLESTLFIATNGGVFKSENNGSNWTLVNNGFPKNAFIWTIVTDGTNLFASVDQNGIYKSTNNGSSWFSINKGIESETFYQIYAENNNIIAAYANGGITFSNDGGLTWSEGSGPINNTQFSSFTSFNNKIYGGGSALFESSDNGVSWQEIIIPGLGPNGIRALYANENKIYAGDDDDIFVYSADVEVWTKIELNTFATITSIVEFDSQIYLIAANRIYVSDNDFQTFTVLSNPFVELSQNDIYINEDVILTVGIKGVFKTDDAGLNWYASNDGLVALNVEALLVDNNDIYLGTPFIGFYYSDDAGLTWELRNNGLNNFSARSISQLLLVNDVLYSITQDGIYSSANKGENWIKRLSPPGVYSISNISYDNGIFSSVTYGNEVYLSSDNMESWTTKPIVGLDFETSFNRIVLNENKLVLSTVNNELFISEDLGDTWANITIPNSFVATLDIDFIDEKLIVATSRGVFITDDLGSTWSMLNGLNIRFNEIEVVNEIIYGATSDGLYATGLDLTGWYPVNENLERELTELEFNSTTIFAGSFRQGLWNLGRDLVNLPEQNLNPFITTWKTDNEGISEDNQITIPIYEANPFTVPLYYNYNVDWGDGTTSEGLSASVTHTYAVAGTYTVAITGSFPRIYFGDFNTETDKQKILSIEQWGDMAWSSMSRAFYNCANLDVKSIDTPNLSNSTNLSQMFQGCSSLVGNELFGNWDLNNVTSTDGMFNGASQFNQAIGSWDVSNVLYMSTMFYKAAAFNQDISLWDVSSVEYLSLTFSQSSFNQPIGSWDVSNVVGFESMFAFNTAFNQDISSWNTENARGMQNMFLQADSFNQNISSWNVANVEDMNGMFSGASTFNQNLGSWDISRVTEMGNMFNSSGLSQENYDNILIGWNALTSKRFDVNLGAFGISYCKGGTARQNLIEIYNWNFSDGGLQINCEANQQRPFVTSWLVNDTNSTITIPTDSNLTYDYEVDWGDGTFDSNVDGDISHSYTEEGIYQVSITGDFPRIIFALGGNNSDLIQSINQWGDIQWVSMYGAFADCNNLDVVAQDKPNLSGVTSTREMFSNCRKLVGNQSFNNWDVSTIVDMDFMFNNTLLFNTNLSNWDVSSVNSMYQMFYESAFNQSLGSWNVSLVAEMEDMFLNSGLSTLNYDNTLVEWSRLPLLQSNLVFDAGTSTFCLGEDARQVLIDNYNWTINDFGQDCSDVQAFVTTWKTDNPGKTSDNQISIPIFGGPYTVDWGDGSIESDLFGESIHDYEITGTYIVSITGSISTISFNSYIGNVANSDATKIIEINQWGNTQWASMSSSFGGCTNLDVTAIDTPDFSQISSLFAMFSSNISLKGNESFNQWDLSSITDLTQVFANCQNFNADISQWDVSSVTAMFNLFSNCQVFNQDIGRWDVSNVTNMGSMFSGASEFNQPIGNWDVSQVTDMGAMFQSTSFNQDISNWDVSQVTDMSFMFGNSTAFNQDISSWDVSSVVDMYYMFGFSQFNQDLSNWDISSVTDMTRIFVNSRLSNENYDKTLIGWSKLPTLQNDVQLGAQQNQYCQSENARQNLIDNYNWVFNDSGKLEGCVITCAEFNLAFNKPTQQSSTYGNGVSDIAVDGNTIGETPWAPEASLQHSTTELQPWWQVDLGETSAIKGITIFNRTDKLQARLNNFYILISETPFGETATLSELLASGSVSNYYFEGEAGLEENFDFDANGRYVRIQLSGTGTLHMAEVEVKGCAGEAVQRPFVTTWTTDNPGTSEDNQITIPTFDGEVYDYVVDWGDGTTSENVIGDITHTYVTPGTYTVSISGDFPRIYFNNSGDTNKLLLVNQWGDVNWSSMAFSFSGCTNLTIQADDTPDLSLVTSFERMFFGCQNMRDSNDSLNDWEVSGIENMSGMFAANSFNGDLSSWDVSSVLDMSNMFGLSNFNADISNWDVSSVTNMRGMFSDAVFNQSLENWNISNVTTMVSMFGDFGGFSNDNYDKTLIGWNQLPSLQSGVQLDAPGNQFCLSEEARQNIIDIYGWTINDGGKAVNCEETECTSFTNIALNKIATQSSTYGDGVASIAIDGNTFGDSPWTTDATLQHTISGEFQSWWQVDLGEILTIKGLNIFNRTDKLQSRLNNFYILISETPFSETATLSELLADSSILNYFFEGEAGLEENIDFETNGRYVRVQLTGTGTLHMAEVEVIGCQSNVDSCSGEPITIVDAAGPFTNIDGTQTLIANPVGGTWGGASTDGTFEPSVLGPGTYTVTYTTDNGSGCVQTTSIDIIVNEDSDTGDCANPVNIALNKTASQSTTYGDGVASIAVDGNTFGDSPWTADATLQHTISGEFQPWWQVDLGELSDIKGVNIFNRTDKLQSRLNNFYILISETPFSETATLSELLADSSILNYFFEGEAGLEENIDFETNGRYVRVQLSGTGTLHMAELEVIGCAGEIAQRPFVTTWKTNNPGLSDDNQITIPTFPGETYDYTVDWGDGTTTENITGDITHTYTSSGSYTVSINGDFPRIYFNDAFDISNNDSDKIIAVNSWGNMEWSSMQVAFSGCENLDVIANDVPNLSMVNSTAAMFLGCSNLVGNLKFNEWNMSNIAEMQSMFNSAILFNQPLNNWNTENALNINGMFSYAASFDQSINSWNIENVENIGVMFGFASSFNQSLQDWDTSSVTNMNGVFAEAIAFNQSLENWDVSNVEDMSGMLDLSGLSNENYDATLIGWSQLGLLQNDVVLGAFEKEYCLSEFARQSIIDNYDWVINDSGKSDDCVITGCSKPGNLAFGKPTEQSTTYGNGISDLAVDGNIIGESPWSADLQHTISGESQSWWQVDLGANFSIENMVIFNRSDKLQSRLNNFYVLVSDTPFLQTATLDDLLTDENILNSYFEGEAGQELDIDLGTTGRYVRVQLSDSGTLHMAEVQVFGCSIAVPLTADLNEMNLYPNPANDYINVSFSEVAKVDVFYVYDISGRMIQSSEISENGNNYLLNVTQLTTGTYFVKAIDNQGIEYYKQMVIKR